MSVSILMFENILMNLNYNTLWRRQLFILVYVYVFILTKILDISDPINIAKGARGTYYEFASFNNGSRLKD